MGCAASAAVAPPPPPPSEPKGGAATAHVTNGEEGMKLDPQPSSLHHTGKRESITWGATPVKAEAVVQVAESQKKLAGHRLSNGPAKKLLKSKFVPAVKLLALRRNSAVMMAQYKRLNVSMHDRAEAWLASAEKLPDQGPCETGLFFASQAGHLETVQMFLKATQEKGVVVPALHIGHAMCVAAANGHCELITFLVAWAEEVEMDISEMKDETNSTPLKLAAGEGHSDILLELLEAGVNIHTKSKAGKTALMAAAEHGHVSCVRILMEAGASISMVTPGGVGAMILAARGGHLEVIQELMASGGDPQEFSLQGETPLFAAVEHSWPEIVKFLLAHGEGTDGRNAEGLSPLMLASMLGHVDCVKALLTAGADVNMGDADGDTPLWAAAKEGYIDVARLLVEAGADVDQERDRGESPLWIAAYRNHIEVVQLLSEAGADIDCIDRKDVTPLLHCAAAGKSQLAKILIDDGADLDAEDSKGNSVVIHAIVRGSIKIVQMLAEAGANLTCTDPDGKTVLEVATECKQGRILLYLAEKLGVEVDELPEDMTGGIRASMDHTRSELADDAVESMAGPSSPEAGGAPSSKNYRSMTSEEQKAARMERMVSQQERREHRAARRVSAPDGSGRGTRQAPSSKLDAEAGAENPAAPPGAVKPSSLRPADWEETRSRHSDADGANVDSSAGGAAQPSRGSDPDDGWVTEQRTMKEQEPLETAS